MNQTTVLTAQLTDAEFLRTVEGLTIPNCAFHHRDHIRLAWIYVRQSGVAAAEERMAQTLRRFAAHRGVPEKYHHTMTVCWMRLVADALRQAPARANFQEFVALSPELLDRKTLHRYYSQPLLDSPAARAGWIEPDITALPE
jgi:hypothetical protein